MMRPVRVVEIGTVFFKGKDHWFTSRRSTRREVDALDFLLLGYLQCSADQSLASSFWQRPRCLPCVFVV